MIPASRRGGRGSNAGTDKVIAGLCTACQDCINQAGCSECGQTSSVGGADDTGKIFVAKLSQGLIGRENAYLLGSLLMAKFQQAAMSRQQQAAKARRDFWIYLDEFQNFVSLDITEMLEPVPEDWRRERLFPAGLLTLAALGTGAAFFGVAAFVLKRLGLRVLRRPPPKGLANTAVVQRLLEQELGKA